MVSDVRNGATGTGHFNTVLQRNLLSNGFHGVYLGARYHYIEYGYDWINGLLSGEATKQRYLAAVGYRWVWRPCLSLGMGVGVGYRKKTSTTFFPL